MRTFTLVRDEDETGISGTGTVAEGVEFTDGQVVLTWIVGEHRSTVLWPGGIASVEAIHGHGGKTRIVWTETLDVATSPADIRRLYLISVANERRPASIEQTASCMLLGNIREAIGKRHGVSAYEIPEWEPCPWLDEHAGTDAAASIADGTTPCEHLEHEIGQHDAHHYWGRCRIREDGQVPNLTDVFYRANALRNSEYAGTNDPKVEKLAPLINQVLEDSWAMQRALGSFMVRA